MKRMFKTVMAVSLSLMLAALPVLAEEGPVEIVEENVEEVVEEVVEETTEETFEAVTEESVFEIEEVELPLEEVTEETEKEVAEEEEETTEEETEEETTEEEAAEEETTEEETVEEEATEEEATEEVAEEAEDEEVVAVLLEEAASVAPVALELTYNGEAQALVAGEGFVYSLDGENVSEEVPTAVDAGEYVVYYCTEGGEIMQLTATIAKADVVFTAPVAFNVI